MKKIFHFLALFTFIAVLNCDSDDKSEGYNGVLKVTVNTSSDVWGYPQMGRTLASTLDWTVPDDGTWMYPLVGGNGVPEGEDDMSLSVISYNDIGYKKNFVYVYDQLGLPDNPENVPSSKDTPVLYRGESSANGSVITITGMAPGDYYVVAFYDYSSGSKQTNLLNRYDRYSIYDGTLTGSPFYDDRVTVTVDEITPAELTLSIDPNWVLGKPGSGMGRVFLRDEDPVPTPD